MFLKKIAILSFVVILFSSCGMFMRTPGRLAEKALLLETENNIDIAESYSNAFRFSDFSEKNLHKLNDTELDYLWNVVSNIKNPNRTEWLENIFKEKENRFHVTGKNINMIKDCISWLADIYVSSGLWDKAYSLQAEYPYLELQINPKRLIYGTDSGKLGWRVLEYSEDENSANVKYSGLDKGSQIVMYMSNGCSYAEMALAAISKTEELKKIFSSSATVMLETFDNDYAKEIKAATGVKNIYYKYSDKEINSIASEGSPKFLFLHHGKTVFEIDGVSKENTADVLLKEFHEGIEILEKESKDVVVSKVNFAMPSDISLTKASDFSRPKSPFALAYSEYFYEPWDMYVLDFINGVIIANNCVRYQSYRAMCWNKSEEDCDNVRNKFRFCVPEKNNSAKPFSIRNLLKGVSPKHKIEFARSIITKDGHIISAYLGGIEKDLGKAKAKEIAAKLAGQEPQFGTVCEISENQDTGAKTISPVSKKGYFCLAE